VKFDIGHFCENCRENQNLIKRAQNIGHAFLRFVRRTEFVIKNRNAEYCYIVGNDM